MKWLQLGLILCSLQLLLICQELTPAKPQPISGTPYLWNKTPRSVQKLAPAKLVGADTTFYIRQDLNSEQVTFIAVPFYQKYLDDKIAIYVEKDEFDAGRVTAADILQLKDYLLSRTPPGSIDPQKGIYTNEINLFGVPADLDHNGRLFVLLIDVRDDYVPGVSETYVAGYFDPLDQTTHADGKGNTGEIIYIDTNPAKVSDLMTLSVVAHELQHLIHHNYDRDESIWLLEGLSELAPRVLGLPSRSFGLFLGNTNRQLNAFDNTLADYAKVGLFTFYLYQRFGARVITDLVQEGSNSLASCRKVLQNAGFSVSEEQLLEDWFIANLLNDPRVADGCYSYGQTSLPAVYSPYFHSNFADGIAVTCPLKLAAAQYIQFSAGRQIQFDLQAPALSGLNLAIVRHYSPPQVTITSLTGGNYSFQDDEFGYAYDKITFIPYRTAITGQAEEIDLNYSATGYGGYSENEIAHDDGQTRFYINLESYEALEKFTGFQEGERLSAVKVKMLENTPITLRIYRSPDLTLLTTLSDLQPNNATWTRFELLEPLALTDLEGIYIAISSRSENALGYCDNDGGVGKAFLKSGGLVYDLRSFSIENTLLTGTWQIRAITQKPVMIPARLIVEPDTLWLWQAEYSGFIKLSNPGTEPLDWRIDSGLPAYLQIIPDSGNLAGGTAQLEVTVDRNLLSPGIYNHPIRFNSNGGEDTVFVTIMEPNRLQAQAALLPTRVGFDAYSARTTLKFVNIGVGAAAVSIESLSPYLAFVPSSVTIPIDDTVGIEAFLNRKAVTSGTLPFRYYDGVDSIYSTLRYTGMISQESSYWLGEPFPNPFRPNRQQQLIIPVTLPTDGSFRVAIYNLRGQLVMRFDQPNVKAGLSILQWNGKNLAGQSVTSGVYLIYLSAGKRTERRKFVILN